MQRVFVIDSNKKPLMPSHPARARELLKAGNAAVFRRFPFTIILKDRRSRLTQTMELKLDPGSKTTWNKCCKFESEKEHPRTVITDI